MRKVQLKQSAFQPQVGWCLSQICLWLAEVAWKLPRNAETGANHKRENKKGNLSPSKYFPLHLGSLVFDLFCSKVFSELRLPAPKPRAPVPRRSGCTGSTSRPQGRSTRLRASFLVAIHAACHLVPRLKTRRVSCPEVCMARALSLSRPQLQRMPRTRSAPAQRAQAQRKPQGLKRGLSNMAEHGTIRERFGARSPVPVTRPSDAE